MNAYLKDILSSIKRALLVCRFLLQLACYVVYFLQPFLLKELIASPAVTTANAASTSVVVAAVTATASNVAATTAAATVVIPSTLVTVAFLALSLLMPPVIDLLNVWTMQEVRKGSKATLIARIQAKPYAYQLRHTSSKILSYITEASLACRNLEDSFVHCVLRLVAMGTLYTIYLFVLGPVLGLCYLAFIAVYLVLSAKLSVQNHGLVSKALSSTADASAAITDVLENTETIKTAQTSDVEIGYIQSFLDQEAIEYSAIQQRNNTIAFIQQLLVVGAAVLMLSVTSIMGATSTAQNSLLVLLYSILNLTGFGGQYLLIREMLDRLRSSLDALEYNIVEPDQELCTFDPDAAALTFKDISFSYDDKSVLAGSSLTFERGKISALVGPNGTGKSTVLKLIAGLLKPESGAITLPCSAANQVVYLGQNSVLFNRSIWDNICYQATPDVQVVMAYIAKLGLDKVITCEDDLRQLTPGDLENRLSGGERQKILIIRALVARPAVLLCDEITSGLDTASAQLFYQLIKRDLPDTTTICIIHKPNEVALCDSVVDINH